MVGETVVPFARAVWDRAFFSNFRAFIVGFDHTAMRVTYVWGVAGALELSLTIRAANLRDRPVMIDRVSVGAIPGRNTFDLSMARDTAPRLAVREGCHSEGFHRADLPLIVPKDGGLDLRVDASLDFYSRDWLGRAQRIPIPFASEGEATTCLLDAFTGKATANVTLGVPGKLTPYTVTSRLNRNLRSMAAELDAVWSRPSPPEEDSRAGSDC